MSSQACALSCAQLYVVVSITLHIMVARSRDDVERSVGGLVRERASHLVEIVAPQMGALGQLVREAELG